VTAATATDLAFISVISSYSDEHVTTIVVVFDSTATQQLLVPAGKGKIDIIPHFAYPRGGRVVMTTAESVVLALDR
jgi:hypothetical protein